MKSITKSKKLENVCYDIRGPIIEEAMRLEEEGHQILKLNIGNPAPFGLFAPDEVLKDLIYNLPYTQGYTESKGLFSARKAIMQYYQQRNVKNIDIKDIYTGNGVSELIMLSMNALLNNGDEILIPSPDYPLWTGAVSLSGGTPVHYICDELSNWYPDIKDIKSKITDKTKGIVVINPNNPTGSVYPKEILEDILQIAREHNLIVFADEIYDKIIYDNIENYYNMASLCDDVFIITLSGLSKTYRVAGFRVGWMLLSGKKDHAKDYIEGLNLLASMRLCSNAPGQSIIQTCLGGYQSINDLIKPGGRLREQRDLIYNRINNIPGLSCTKPEGAFYVFPKIDTKKFNITDDEKFVYDLLVSKKVLLVHGRGFNWKDPDHFRIVFLPHKEDLNLALDKLEDFLKNYKQN